MAHFFLLSFDQLINLFSLTDLHIPLQGIEAIQKIREKDFYNINLNEMSLQKLCWFFFSYICFNEKTKQTTTTKPNLWGKKCNCKAKSIRFSFFLFPIDLLILQNSNALSIATDQNDRSHQFRIW